MSAAPTIAAIKVATAAAYGLSVRDLESPRTAREYARPRQVAMYLAKEMTGNSLPMIGREFRRDHTTVMHALQVVEKRLAGDDVLQKTMEQIRAGLERYGDLRIPSHARSLEEVARWAVRTSIRLAKAGGPPIKGDREAVVLALAELFGEVPIYRMCDLEGRKVEILVSPEGTWTQLELDAEGPDATVIAAGRNWRPI